MTRSWSDGQSLAHLLRGLTRRALAPLSLTAAAAVVVAGCSAPSTGHQASGSGSGSGNGATVTVGLREAPDALDPTTSTTFVSRIVYANMCQKLYDVNSSLTIVPQLAAALPTVSSNGLTYTIKLRPGVKFNDGTPLTAAAVKTTLNWYKSNPQSARAPELAQVKSVSASGPQTVVLHLSTPFAPLTSILADRSGMILSPTQLHKLGKNFGRDPVCVGPFSFVSRPSTNQITLAKSKYYYGKAAVHPAKLIFQVITDDSARAADLQSGEIQVADRIAPQDVSTIAKGSSTRIVAQDSLGYEGLDFNVGNVHGSLKAPDPGKAGNPFAQHPGLREAFELSMNRAALNKAAFDGQYTPGCTPIPPHSPWAVQVPCPAQNIAKARQLVKASGMKTPIHVSLMLENAPQEIQIGTVIQSMAKAAGFAVSLQPTEFTTALTRGAAGKYDMFQIGWSGRVDPDQNIFADWYPRSALNYTGADDPVLNKLMTQARTTLGTSARKALYTKIVQRMHVDRNIVYLWYDKLDLGLRKDVSGVAFYPDGLIRLAGARIGSG